MATIFNENVVFSISALLLKNAEYKKQIEALISPVRPRSLNYESYMMEIEFGNKIIKTSVATPDITLITLRDVKELAHRIRENNAMIKKLVKSQPAYDMTEQEIEDVLTWMGIEQSGGPL